MQTRLKNVYSQREYGESADSHNDCRRSLYSASIKKMPLFCLS